MTQNKYVAQGNLKLRRLFNVKTNPKTSTHHSVVVSLRNKEGRGGVLYLFKGATMTYQVKDWNEHFENNKSRERKKCSFVCVPNKQDGKGLIEILTLKDGLAIYGVWCLILGLCSKHQERNGYLTENGMPDDCPLTARDMALLWRRTEAEINRALDVLASQAVGWIIVIDGVPAKCPPSAHMVPQKRREEKRNEEDIMEIPKHLIDLWPSFIEVREKKKAVNSLRALTMILNELKKHPEAEQRIMVEKAIRNSWKDVYPLKPNEAPKAQVEHISETTRLAREKAAKEAEDRRAGKI